MPEFSANAPKNSCLSLRHALALLLAASFFILPALFAGPKGSDLYCQALWVKLFTQQFWQGDLYPRWLLDAYAGRGSPAFFYYPPLAYYVTSFFGFLRVFDHLGYYAIVASALLGIALSGYAFYGWMRREGVGDDAALTGALLYMLAPAHVAYSFYFVLLFSFVWAFAWLPLLLWSAKKMALGERYGVAMFALSLCGLVTTNLPMTLMGGPIAVAYALLHFRRHGFRLQGMRLAAGVALGFGLSAFYVLPMTSYLHFTILKRQWTEISSDYHTFFLGTDFGDIGNRVYGGAAALMAVLLIVYCMRVLHRTKEFLFFAVLTALALFMLLPFSLPIWESMNIMHIIQFPQRFFAVASLGLAALAAFTMPRLRLLACLLLLFYGGVTLIAAFWPRETDANAETLFALNIEQHGNYMTSYDLVEKYYSPWGIENAKEHMESVEVADGKAEVQVKRWAPRDIVLDYRAYEHSILRVRQFFFPGFRATQDGQGVRIGRERKTGQVLLDVPEGSGEIHLTLNALDPEKEGVLISFTCLILLLVLFTVENRQRIRLSKD